jgi:hypothetical protein
VHEVPRPPRGASLAAQRSPLSSPPARAPALLPPSSPQIPNGALPLGGEPVVHVSQVVLPPHGCHVSTLLFYFPRPGSFAQPPPSVARGGRPAWLPAAPPPRLAVRAPGGGGADGGGAPGAAAFDWAAFARAAAAERLAAFLRDGDLALAQPLEALGPRCADARAYRAVTGALGARGVFEPEVWKVRRRGGGGGRHAWTHTCGAVEPSAGAESTARLRPCRTELCALAARHTCPPPQWAVVHGDAAGLAALLPATDLVRDLGVPLATPLVALGGVPGDPGWLGSTEFWPWVNAYCRPIPGDGAPRRPPPVRRLPGDGGGSVIALPRAAR